MENPATWDDTTKLINAALDYKSNASDQASKVYSALSKADLLAPSGDRGSACLTAITEAIKHWNELMEQHFCGQSLPSMIHVRLTKDSMLK